MLRNRMVAPAVLLLGATILGACSSNSPSEPPATTHPTGHAVYSTSVANGPWGVAISSQGLAYMTRPLTDSVAVIDLSGPSVVTSFQVGNRPDDIAFNAAGTTAYVTNLDDGTVGVINTATGIQTTTYPVAAQPLTDRCGLRPVRHAHQRRPGGAQHQHRRAAQDDCDRRRPRMDSPSMPGPAACTWRSTAGTVTVINTTTNAASGHLPGRRDAAGRGGPRQPERPLRGRTKRGGWTSGT